MKNIATVITLVSLSIAGSAVAAPVSPEISHFGTGTDVTNASHFIGKEALVAEHGNLKQAEPVDPVYGMDLFIGSK